jgi:hypothetical protein
VSDEDVIFNRDTLAYKGVRRNLAARTDLCSGLDLDERANPALITDHAAIEVYQVRMEDPDVTADLNIFCDRHSNCSLPNCFLAAEFDPLFDV